MPDNALTRAREKLQEWSKLVDDNWIPFDLLEPCLGESVEVQREGETFRTCKILLGAVTCWDTPANKIAVHMRDLWRPIPEPAEPQQPQTALLTCPFCGDTGVEVEHGDGWYSAVCLCGAEGPAAATDEKARLKWNEALRPRVAEPAEPPAEGMSELTEAECLEMQADAEDDRMPTVKELFRLFATIRRLRARVAELERALSENADIKAAGLRTLLAEKERKIAELEHDLGRYQTAGEIAAELRAEPSWISFDDQKPPADTLVEVRDFGEAVTWGGMVHWIQRGTRVAKSTYNTFWRPLSAQVPEPLPGTPVCFLPENQFTAQDIADFKKLQAETGGGYPTRKPRPVPLVEEPAEPGMTEERLQEIETRWCTTIPGATKNPTVGELIAEVRRSWSRNAAYWKHCKHDAADERNTLQAAIDATEEELAQSRAKVIELQQTFNRVSAENERIRESDKRWSDELWRLCSSINSLLPDHADLPKGLNPGDMLYASVQVLAKVIALKVERNRLRDAMRISHQVWPPRPAGSSVVGAGDAE